MLIFPLPIKNLYGILLDRNFDFITYLINYIKALFKEVEENGL